MRGLSPKKAQADAGLIDAIKAAHGAVSMLEEAKTETMIMGAKVTIQT